MPTYTAAADFKDAFLTAAQGLFAGTDVLVCFGHPGMTQPDDIISFGAVETLQDVANYGPRRSREETLVLEVTISCYRAGGQEMEKVASDRAYYLLGQLEAFARVTDTTIGGTVRDCFLVSTQSDGETRPEMLAQGRIIEISARFQAHARISS